MRFGSISVPLLVLVLVLVLALVAPAAHGAGSGLLPNPDFDDLDDMDIVEGWYELFQDVSEMNNILDDADDCPFSGAGDGINTSPVEAGGAAWSACSNQVVTGQSYQVTGMIRFPVGTDSSYASVNALYTTSLNCFGSGVGQFFSVPSEIDWTTNDWTPFHIAIGPAPKEALALRVTIYSVKDFAEDNVADVYFDKIYLTPADFVFSEDFESGSACRWSNEVGLE